MTSLQETSAHSPEALASKESPTGTFSEPQSVNDTSNALLELADVHRSMMRPSCTTPCDVEGNRGTRSSVVDRRVYMGSHPDATSCLTQAHALIYPTVHGNSYQSVSTNAVNNVGVNSFNYGGYYRPSALCYGEYGEGYTSGLLSSRGAADFPGNSRAFLKINKGEQRSSCLIDSRFAAMNVQGSSSKRDESEARSLLNAPYLTQPYFPADELRYQPVSYPRLPLEQSRPSLDFTSRFPTQMPPSHLAVPPLMSTQSGFDGMSTPANLNQHSTPAQHTHCQPQTSSLISGNGFSQNFSQRQDGHSSYFPQPSFNQVIREFQSNPLGAFEGIQTSNRRFSFDGLYGSENANLRQLSDVCATSNLFNCPPRLSDHQMASANLQREWSENDVFTRIAVGPSMTSEGRTCGGKSSSSGSCMFSQGLGEKRSRAASLSGEINFDKRPDFLQGNKKLSDTVKEAGIKSYDDKKPLRMVDTKVTPKNRTRTETRDCECTVCGKKLARASTLKIHMRQHTGDRPFKCTSCGKTFAQAGLLQSHRRTHTGERPFTCSYCRKKFSHSGALKTHVRTHTGEKPHKCPVPGCNLAFGDSSTLAKHTRTHTGERPYSCDICGKRFTQSGNMHKHKKSVHSLKKHSSGGGTSVERSPVEILLLASER